MKKKTIAIIIGCLLLAGLSVLFLFENDMIGGKQPSSELFAVKDTNNITKIFIADMNGEQSL